MITPEEIVRRAERKYHAVLRAWLLGQNIFPIEFPVGLLSNDLAERRQQIDRLREGSQSGYILEWDTVNMQALGKQTMPRRAIIVNLDDYLLLIRKRTEFQHFTTDIMNVRQKFPALEHWLQSYPQAVIEQHGKWDNLLQVCDYFVKNPRPNVYIRELPISVHTKFIETHNRVLRDLLDRLLPSPSINTEASDFNNRFGLKDKPSLVRVRMLEEQLDWQYGLKLDDLCLPVDQLAHLLTHHIKPRHVIIVENLINFLTLPKIHKGIGLLGSGYAVHLLRDVRWLLECDLIYWGDIDADGFQILSDLRSIFPKTRSAMMDIETFKTYEQYAVSGKRSRSERYGGLTEAEALLAQDVLQYDWRLEQEHIPQAYAEMRLKQLFLNNTTLHSHQP